MVGLLALSLAWATGCAARVAGAPDGEVVRPSITPGVAELPAPGRCTDGGLTAVDCARPHGGEVVDIGEFTGLGDDYPGERDFRRQAIPACRAALAGYLGSADHDATRLQAHVLWPSRDGWAKGDRWRLCTAVELTTDGRRGQRTGRVKDLLKAAGFAGVQLCAQGSPAHDADPVITACDGPHRAEAVPGVLDLGRPGDPAPPRDQVDARAKEHCATAVAGYVGAERQDVFASWRSFGSQAWSEGFTTVVCYAEATRPFTGRLWGLGTKALPA
ncbi:putative regulator of septum formation [Saccharothrix australiensis]|uniref:Putative regulator of septum formation n=1 Tax=Saccharothrix australiensis TaxID=2072 RepID=A0A495VTB0_9PSEU|nr:putative regulator of septum formation [Saccharothrix australiensis]